jgi:hypothetical protein
LSSFQKHEQKRLDVNPGVFVLNVARHLSMMLLQWGCDDAVMLLQRKLQFGCDETGM